MKVAARLRRKRRTSSFVRSSGIIISVITAAWVSNADIMAMDLFEAGDQLLTRDTASGVDLLDVGESVDLSFDDVTSGVGGWSDLGFSHATNSELRDLFHEIEPLVG